jgi:hypothetical protein
MAESWKRSIRAESGDTSSRDELMSMVTSVADSWYHRGGLGLSVHLSYSSRLSFPLYLFGGSPAQRSDRPKSGEAMLITCRTSSCETT